MSKNFWYGTIFVVIIVILYFVFSERNSIKNYPSNGSDIIAFGDSLVEGVGASQGNDFVSILSKSLGKPIINLGISGNTTKDGLDRLNQLDKYDPKVVILLLGGNDYLKKIPEDETFSNLEKIIKNIQDRGAVVLLLGIRGGLLTDKFDQKFEELSNNNETAFVSNVLSGLILDQKYMSDTIHPNDLGYQKIAERVYPVLFKILKK